MKKHLTRQEEFDILKIVLDKFLLLGVFFLAYGVYKLIESSDFWLSISVLLVGVVILIVLSIILLKEYEFIKS